MTASPASHRRRPRVVLGRSSVPQRTETCLLGTVRELAPRGWAPPLPWTVADEDAWRVPDRSGRLPVPAMVGIRTAEISVPPGDTGAHAAVRAHATALHLVARGR